MGGWGELDWEQFNSGYYNNNGVIPFAILKLNRHFIDKSTDIEKEEPSGS